MSERCYYNRPEDSDQQRTQQAQLQKKRQVLAVNKIIQKGAQRHEQRPDQASNLDVVDNDLPVVLDERLSYFD